MVCLVFQLLKTSERRLNKLRGHTIVADTTDRFRSAEVTFMYFMPLNKIYTTFDINSYVFPLS